MDNFAHGRTLRKKQKGLKTGTSIAESPHQSKESERMSPNWGSMLRTLQIRACRGMCLGSLPPAVVVDEGGKQPSSRLVVQMDSSRLPSSYLLAVPGIGAELRIAFRSLILVHITVCKPWFRKILSDDVM